MTSQHTQLRRLRASEEQHLHRARRLRPQQSMAEAASLQGRFQGHGHAAVSARRLALEPRRNTHRHKTASSWGPVEEHPSKRQNRTCGRACLPDPDRGRAAHATKYWHSNWRKRCACHASQWARTPTCSERGPHRAPSRRREHAEGHAVCAFLCFQHSRACIFSRGLVLLASVS